MICSNSLYGVVARIAVAEDLGLKILKLAFQVFNNFSLFYNVVMNETDIKQPFFFFFVLEREAEMYTQRAMAGY